MFVSESDCERPYLLYAGLNNIYLKNKLELTIIIGGSKHRFLGRGGYEKGVGCYYYFILLIFI